MSAKHTFSIEHSINPETEQPFGPKYAGNFTVHRPTIADNGQIALNYAALTGGRTVLLNPLMLDSHAINLMYVFCNMKVLADEKPEWFNEDELYEEDEAAVRAVHEEVERWLGSFRPKSDSKGSQQGGGEPAVLVSTEVQASTAG